MKSIMRYFSMAALVVAVATLVGCTKEEINNGLTFTTTVEMPSNVTKDLTGNGVKTFAVGECIKVTCGGVTCTSEPLTTSDISHDGKAAKFTFNFASAPTLTADTPVSYEYPATYSGLDGQNGTIAYIAEHCDYATWTGTVTVEGKLPSNIQLANQYAILKLFIKNSVDADITNTITGLNFFNGANTVTVSRSATAGPIYVAVPAVTSGDIVFTATDGSNNYFKTVSGKTLDQGSLYPVELSMNPVATVTWNSTNVFNVDHRFDEVGNWETSATYEGITISFNGSGPSAFKPYCLTSDGNIAQLDVFGGEDDSFTFTAPEGKLFTKIEIIDNGFITFDAYGDWTKSAYNKIVWSGTPAHEVTLGGTENTFCDDLNSIVFYLGE